MKRIDSVAFGRGLGGRCWRPSSKSGCKLTICRRSRIGRRITAEQLTRFLPAKLSADGSELTPISWRGSSDVPAVARGNVFLVADPEQESWKAGDWMPVLLK